MQVDISYSEKDIRDKAAADGITHISTGVAIVQDSKILLARRAAGDFLGGVYELPGGGVDPGESILDGAIREVQEETGLTVSRVMAVFEGFDYSTDKKPKVRQINFAVEVEPGEVVLDPAEHDDYVWADKAMLTNIKTTDNMHSCVMAALKTITNKG